MIADFYNREANKYFDICEYNLDYFTDLIEGKRNAGSNTILLSEDILNNEIISLIDAIHDYTGIYQVRIQSLFTETMVKGKAQTFTKSENIKKFQIVIKFETIHMMK